MASIWDWSQTAASNSNSDSAINWVEGQAAKTVNNSARAMMGRVAEILDDLGAVSTTTNVTNAYSLTANSSFTALADGLIVGFIANAANTDAATLAVNSLTAKSIRRLGPNGADDAPLYGNQLRASQKYVAVYSTAANSAAGGWILLNPSAPGFLEIDALSSAPTPVAGAAIYVDSSKKLYYKDTSGTSVQMTAGDSATSIVLSVNGRTGAVTLGASDGIVPSGVVSPFAGSSAPTGWLICDGSAVSRTTYAALFTAIGTTFGSGDGTTTFNVPNLSGRTVAGKESTATLLTSAASGVDGATLGASGGAQTHILAASEIPTHHHSFSGSATPTVSGNNAIAAFNGSAASTFGSGPTGTLYAASQMAAMDSLTISGNTGDVGSGAGHNNVQPTIVLNYIIKS